MLDFERGFLIVAPSMTAPRKIISLICLMVSLDIVAHSMNPPGKLISIKFLNVSFKSIIVSCYTYCTLRELKKEIQDVNITLIPMLLEIPRAASKCTILKSQTRRS